jgi:hypothetical protein
LQRNVEEEESGKSSHQFPFQCSAPKHFTLGGGAEQFQSQADLSLNSVSSYITLAKLFHFFKLHPVICLSQDSHIDFLQCTYHVPSVGVRKGRNVTEKTNTKKFTAHHGAYHWMGKTETNKQKILQILPVVSSVWEESCFSQEVMPEDSTLKLRLGR